MADPQKPVPTPNASGGAGGSATPPVAKPAPPSQPGIASPGTVGPKPKLGEVGYQFLHSVDSPLGQEERREHERLRKASKRAQRATLVEPPPLVPVHADIPGQPPAANRDALGPLPGESLPAGDPPPVPWQPELVADLLNELVEAAEDGRVGKFATKCQEAGLMPKLIAEIERDAHFPKTAKIILKRSLPRLACKWLNKSGVSAELQDEVSVITALILVIQHDRKMSAKLDELIALQKPPTPPTPATAASEPSRDPYLQTK